MGFGRTLANLKFVLWPRSGQWRGGCSSCLECSGRNKRAPFGTSTGLRLIFFNGLWPCFGHALVGAGQGVHPPV